MTVYDSGFFEYTSRNSRRSAQVIAAYVCDWFHPRRVLDVGCGEGVWLNEWRRLGVDTVVGVDGAYVDPRRLLVSAGDFRAADLGQPFDLGERFDLVQCLEVAEHLPHSRAQALVDDLIRHGDLVMFSAAVPGQIGEHHVNERPPAYWRQKFEARDYVLIDALRPLICNNRNVQPWYRSNCMLYIHYDRLPQLPTALVAHRIEGGAPIPNYTPLGLRLAFALASLLPVWANHAVAVAGKNVDLWRARRRHRALGARTV